MAKDNVNALLDDILSAKDHQEAIDLEDSVLDPLIEEVNLIQNSTVRNFVRSCLLKAPDSFWKAPSSLIGDVNALDEHAGNGHVLHTKRVVRVTEILADSQNIVSQDLDLLLAAAILHGVNKFSEVNEDYVYDPLYPYTINFYVDRVEKEDKRNLIDSDPGEISYGSSSLEISLEYKDIILRLIRCHRGIWSAIPETIPKNNLEWIVHQAVLIVSKIDYIIDGDDVKEWRWFEPR